MAGNWFIAFEVQIQHDPQLDSLFGRSPSGLRKIPSADLHITVAFLGRIEQTAAVGAMDQLVTPPELSGTFDALTTMGPRNRPSAIALVDSHNAELLTYISQVRPPALIAAGAPPDVYPVKPHCTIARFPRKAPAALRNAGLNWARSGGSLSIPYHLEGPNLYTSADPGTGRLYRMVPC